MISNRLKRIAELVKPCRCVADIGTDHGYVPILLAKRGDIEKIIGMDIRRGPLEKARYNISTEGLSDRIELRLSDGAEKLKPSEAEVIVISGMGGELISRIMSAGADRFKAADTIIISPQSELFNFRTFLLENGYKIENEEMVFEDEKYYFLMTVHPETDEGIYNDIEKKYGKSLLARRDELLKQYILRELEASKKILASILEVEGQRAEEKRDILISGIKEMEKILEEW